MFSRSLVGGFVAEAKDLWHALPRVTFCLSWDKHMKEKTERVDRNLGTKYPYFQLSKPRVLKIELLINKWLNHFVALYHWSVSNNGQRLGTTEVSEVKYLLFKVTEAWRCGLQSCVYLRCWQFNYSLSSADEDDWHNFISPWSFSPPLCFCFLSCPFW